VLFQLPKWISSISRKKLYRFLGGRSAVTESSASHIAAKVANPILLKESGFPIQKVRFTGIFSPKEAVVTESILERKKEFVLGRKVFE
jgi:hypothetical protein